MLFWFLYFARLHRRTASLVAAICFRLIPMPFVLHSVFARESVREFAFSIWTLASILCIGYFKQRPR